MTAPPVQTSADLMKRSLLELRKLRARIEELERAVREPIAIIGLGCRFPGRANDPEAFWQLLMAGRDAIVEIPADRWDVAAYFDPDPTAPGKSYAHRGGFLEQVDRFDAHFFGISRREAMSLDPQQRMLLEVAWEALENGGQAVDRLYGTQVGVFVGIASFEYAAHVLRSADPSTIDPYFATGTAFSAAAGRLSFTLGLTGPSMAIDTACSSSLVALHVACQSLRARECDLALAGGVNLMVAPEVNIAFSKARLLDPDGECKTFDAAANGYVRGEGCGVVALKRLSDAVANRDHIVALIRGSAVNQDGPSGALVVPNGLAQQAVIRQALDNAGVSPDDVDYIEAHGTGTSLGDPIEVGALGRVFGKDRPASRPLVVGSVKTNIGHLESAAGMAGLLKVALSLERETIPAHLHFHQPNPNIPWEQLPIVIPTQARAWSGSDKPRLAGLSSFGFTGTNVHVILEEAPAEAPSALPDRSAHVLMLSAKTDSALRELAARFADDLAARPDVALGDVCFSANTGRARFRERLAVVASSIAELRGKLREYVQDRACEGLFRSPGHTEKEEAEEPAYALARLAVQDPGVDWVAFDRDYQRHRISLPTYPFDRERFWIEPAHRDQHAPPPELYYRVAWEPYASPHSESPDLHGTWLICADRGGTGASLAAQLTAGGAECLLVYPGQPFGQLPGPLRGAIYLWALDESQEMEDAGALSCRGALELVQALATNQSPNWLGLWVVTRGAQTVLADAELTGLPQTPLWGLGKAIRVELPWLACHLVDLDPATSEGDSGRLLGAVTGGADELALRGDGRYVSRLVRAEAPGDQVVELQPDRTYLITGGLGGVGLRVARWMAENGARHVVLLGRSPPSGEALEGIQDMQRLGVEVVVVNADVSRMDELADALQRIAISLPPLAGVIHGAGIFNDRMLLQHEWSLFAQVFAPKVRGSWNLHALTRDMDLDFFVMFSSAATMLPAAGMSSYMAANTFEEALARYRQCRGLTALTISWGPWHGTGMAQRAGRARENQWQSHGMDLLAPSRALQELGRLLTRESGHLGVFSVRWRDLLRLFSGVPVPAYLEKFSAEQNAGSEGQPSSTFDRLLMLLPEERASFLEQYLKQRIVGALGADGSGLSNTDSLPQAGVDSLMMMEVLNSLRDDLRFMVYPREFYEQPTIRGLARYLAAEFERAHGKSAASNAVAVSAAPWARAPAVPFATEPEREPLAEVVFILSSPRSGSTLLRVMLAGHPALFAPPELHLLPFATMGERAHLLEKTHLGEGLQRAVMVLLDLDAERSGALIDDWVRQNLDIREVYAKLQQHAGSRRVVDKSPSYAASREILERAERMFRGARYIHLVRHPYAAIESFVRLRMDRLLGADTADPHQVAEEIWTTTNRNILETVAAYAPDRYHRMYYEDLVREPRAVLTRCCDFLGIPFDEALMHPYGGQRMTEGIHAVSAPVGDPNFLQHDDIDARLGERWREIDLAHPLRPTTSSLATELGYELSHDIEIAAPREVFVETVRGLRLCLCQWGPEDGPLVLLLHGILEQGTAWLAVAPILVEQGFHVVAPDLRGHGRSDHVGRGGSYQLMDFVADVDAIVAQAGAAKFTLVGHSMGAAVAAVFATARPAAIGSLVLVEPPLAQEQPADEGADAERLAVQLDYLAASPAHPTLPDLETAASRIQRAAPGMSTALASKLAERNTVSVSGGLEWRWDPLLGTRVGLGVGGDHATATRFADLLRNLHPPTTIVFGTDSTIQRDLLGLKTVVTAGGHNLHLEKPAALAEIIARAAQPKSQPQP